MSELDMKKLHEALDYADKVMRGVREGLAKVAKAERMIRPTYGEPEGARPGTRPTVAEPDDPTSPAGFPQTQPIGSSPGHASTGSREFDSTLGWRIEIHAVALVIWNWSGKRGTIDGVEQKLRDEVVRQMREHG